MGRGSNLSVIGLYNYSENLFNGLSLPAGMTDDDKSVLIDNILFECADLEVLYPSWEFMFRAISAWSKKQLPTWSRIYNLSLAEYDPLENYNRTETVTETREGAQEHSGNDVVAMSGSDTDTSKTTGSDTHQTSGTDTQQTTGTDTEETTRDNSETSTGTNSTVVASDSTDTHTGSDVTTEQKTAFDANTYADTRKTTLQHGETISNDTNSTTTGNESATIETDDDETVTTTHNTTVTDTQNTTVTDTHNTTVTDTHQRGTSETTTHGLKVSNDETFTRNVHMYGNIGVTTSQQMAESEIELSPKLNMFNIIVNEFKERFCLQVY